MKCMEFFKTRELADAFIATLTWPDADVEIDECYMPNDEIPREEYERTIEDYHGFAVWFNPKPY